MIRRPPRSTQSRSSAASDVYKRQVHGGGVVDQLQNDCPLFHLFYEGNVSSFLYYLKRKIRIVYCSVSFFPILPSYPALSVRHNISKADCVFFTTFS
eukprot:TRINITY_DN322_c0_g2_i8.p1 TRINITY_DN322_c0_g2~~TRINITY_DN322_c0_g2_i8.p1  ORF type:complete len:105 (-),score=5.18 TRINITY_DN322_c0_g2_i8:39-329(-)